jgi:hypothetical protein
VKLAQPISLNILGLCCAFAFTDRSFAVEDTSSDVTEQSILTYEFTAKDIARLPLEKNLSAIIMLTPGAVHTDDRSGNYVSMSGSSVADNAYYVNGLDITNARSGHGHAQLPFEFIESVSVSSSSNSVKYGGKLGGLVSIQTKSGSNDWNYSASTIYTPLARSSETLNYRHGIRDLDGEIKFITPDESAKTEGNISLSGPIIEDELYFYVLYNPRNISSEISTSKQSDEHPNNNAKQNNAKQHDAFWAAKLDWQATDFLKFDYTAFSDSRKHYTPYDKYDLQSQRGGLNQILTMSLDFHDSLNFTASKGRSNQQYTDGTSADNTCPVIIDVRTSETPKNIGCWLDLYPTTIQAQQDQTNFGFNYSLDRHTISFGSENLETALTQEESYSGGVYYRYLYVESGEQFKGLTFQDSTDVLMVSQYFSGGEFSQTSRSVYLQDEWQVTNDFNVTIGFRNESYNLRNTDSSSDTFKFKNQWLPKATFEWQASSNIVIFGQAFRTIKSISLATLQNIDSDEYKSEEFYILDSLNNDGTPVFDQSTLLYSCNRCNFYIDNRERIDSRLKPTHKDTLSFGALLDYNNGWTTSAHITYSKLSNIIDDISINEGLVASGYDVYDEQQHYVLTNPGTDINVWYDVNEDGELSQSEFLTLRAAALGFEKPAQEYTALTLTADKTWDRVWSLNASYVWSKLSGNTFGNLPNDSTHQLKAYGAYQVHDSVDIGANLYIASGRPLSKLGKSNPLDPNWSEYGFGSTFYQANGEFNQRGSAGRTDTLVNLDFNARYVTHFKGVDIELALAVFNVFNANAVTRTDELAELDFNGTANPTYGQALAYQLPRRLQFSAAVRF